MADRGHDQSRDSKDSRKKFKGVNTKFTFEAANADHHSRQEFATGGQQFFINNNIHN